MPEAKTRPTPASVEDYLDARATPAQLADCRLLMDLLGRATGGATPTMWGPSIVGYGRYAYRYDSGRTGESCAIGFAIRGRELVVYLTAEAPEQAALLTRLGPHKLGKACLYLRGLAEIDLAVLEQLVTATLAELGRRYPVSFD